MCETLAEMSQLSPHGGRFSWEVIAAEAGMPPPFVDGWVRKLVTLRLIYFDGQAWSVNGGLAGFDLVGPLPISNR
jgi:hypothetical protein